MLRNQVKSSTFGGLEPSGAVAQKAFKLAKFRASQPPNTSVPAALAEEVPESPLAPVKKSPAGTAYDSVASFSLQLG